MMHWIRCTVVVALLLTPAGCKQDGSTPFIELHGRAMGTSWQVRLPDCRTSATAADLSSEIAQLLQDLEAQMSHWRDDSVVSRFNDHPSRETIVVPDDLARVVSVALQVHEQTQGALDITAEPLIRLWGFGPSGRTGFPSDTDIETQLEYVGSDHLTLSQRGEREFLLRKSHPQVRIDLSALAKGYAIDRIAERLEKNGFESYLIELGGEIRARGTKGDGAAWRVGLEQADPGRIGQSRRAILLQDQSLATSGNYRNFRTDPESPGTIYSHILDPRTGRPVTHDLAAVSVITDTAMEADALATALMVMGPAEGYAWAVEHEIAATFVVHRAEGTSERSTPAFPRLRQTE